MLFSSVTARMMIKRRAVPNNWSKTRVTIEIFSLAGYDANIPTKKE